MYATTAGRIAVQVQPLQNNYSLVKLCDRVALITKALKRKGKGGRMARVQSGYFGFVSREAATTFAEAVSDRFGVEVTIRKPQRLSGVLLEAKIRDFDGLEALAWEKAKQPTVQEARASLEVDWEDEHPYYDAKDTWSKPFYSEDGTWVGVPENGYSEEDARANYEDLRTTSLPW
jgi:hypothetical protein